MSARQRQPPRTIFSLIKSISSALCDPECQRDSAGVWGIFVVFFFFLTGLLPAQIYFHIRVQHRTIRVHFSRWLVRKMLGSGAGTGVACSEILEAIFAGIWTKPSNYGKHRLYS